MLMKIRSKKKRDWKRQAVRREEALARQEAYDKLTPKEKLDRLNKGGFSAKRQRAKLKVGI